LTNTEEKLARIEDTSERFPLQMLLIHEIFQFSFAEASKISMQFSSNAELIGMLELLRSFVVQSGLEQNQISLLDNLINEEIEVISFSQASRSSVISL
jgi:hypothetical protein